MSTMYGTEERWKKAEGENIHTLVLIERVWKILLQPSLVRMWPGLSHAAAIGRFRSGKHIESQLRSYSTSASSAQVPSDVSEVLNGEEYGE